MAFAMSDLKGPSVPNAQGGPSSPREETDLDSQKTDVTSPE